jgi:hypothetical protein
MKPLIIPPTEFAPKFYFNPNENIFEISGFSRPEDVAATYMPVINYLKDYELNYIDNTEISEKSLTLSLKMKYFNSSSSKYLLDIIIFLISLTKKGLNLKIEWYYDKGDDTIKEAGEDINDIAEFPFTFIEVKN